MLEIKNLTKSYGNTNVLHDLDLSVEEGMMIAIMGRSGSGKSTLLNAISGLVSVQNGSIKYKNEKIMLNNFNKMSAFREHEIGFVLQNYALLNDRSAFDNIMLPLKFRRMKRENAKKTVYEYANALEIEDKLHLSPDKLSGGECQRVAIARALVKNPSLILADEPTGALDSENEQIILNIFKKVKGMKKTIIIVTHDSTVAHECDRILKMKDGKLISLQSHGV